MFNIVFPLITWQMFLLPPLTTDTDWFLNEL